VKSRFSLFAVFVCVTLCGVALAYYRQIEWPKPPRFSVYETANTIRKGDSSAKVLKTLGPPRKKRPIDAGGESWHYFIPDVGSGSGGGAFIVHLRNQSVIDVQWIF
jgi:hypothetical protein